MSKYDKYNNYWYDAEGQHAKEIFYKYRDKYYLKNKNNHYLYMLDCSKPILHILYMDTCSDSRTTVYNIYSHNIQYISTDMILKLEAGEAFEEVCKQNYNANKLDLKDEKIGPFYMDDSAKIPVFIECLYTLLNPKFKTVKETLEELKIEYETIDDHNFIISLEDYISLNENFYNKKE